MKIKMLLLSALFLILLSGCNDSDTVIDDLDESNKQHGEAQQLIREQSYNEAEAILNELIETNPDQAIYHVTKADIYISQQQYDNAIEDLEIAIEKDTENTEAHSNLAAIYMLKEEFETALEYVNAGLKFKPDHTEFLFKKGQLLYLTGNYNESIEVLDELTDAQGYFEVYRFLGLSHLALKNNDKAIESFEKYLENAPENIQMRDAIEKQIEALR